MVNHTFMLKKCETCQAKLPNNVKLTKSDANYINYLNIPWTCKKCIFEILPVNVHLQAKHDKKGSKQTQS